MIIVLVILGLAVAIAASRGPARSHRLQVRRIAAAVSEGLRGARGRASAANRLALVAGNGEHRTIAVERGPTIGTTGGFGQGISGIAGRAAGG